MTMRRLPHALIDPNPSQPRKTFEAVKLAELADSIVENGLAQPITVRPKGAMFGEISRYEIVMGERRWRAIGLIIERGFKRFAEIDCHVVEMDETARDVMAIVENAQRVDVLPLEEAAAFQRLLDGGMEIDEVARRVGKPRWRIEERLRLMNLEPGLLKLCASGFDNHVAQEIARLPNHRDQIALTQAWNKGAITGFAALKAAVGAVNDGLTQQELFSAGAAPRAEVTEIEVLSQMEQRVDVIVGYVASGWKDGMCIIATKVSRDRARLMADKLGALRGALMVMEKQLRVAAAQIEAVSIAAE